MKKNRLTKQLLAASMLLAASSLVVSCGNSDNPLSITVDNTTGIPNVTLTSNGAVISATTAADISAAFAQLVDDIKAKGVGAGKEYVVEISSEAFNTIAAQNITIPEIEGATINLVIKDPFTQATTVVIGNSTPAGARGMARTRAEEDEQAVDKMYITLPDVANGVIPTFEFSRPNTEIVLRSANGNSLINIKDVNEGSCAGTFRLGVGVSVDTYKYTQRKEKEHVWLYTENMTYRDEENDIEKVIALDWEEQDRTGDGLIIRCLEILPSDNIVRLRIGGEGVEQLILADGVKVETIGWDSDEQKYVSTGSAPSADESVISKGTSTILLFDDTESPEWKNWINGVYNGIIFVKKNGESINALTFRYGNESTNCTFNSEVFYFGSQWNAYEDGVTISENKFISNGDTHTIEINVPAESEDKLFELTFNKCDFSANTKFKVNFKSEGYTDFVARIYLTDCTYGEGTLTNASSFVESNPTIPENAKLYYNIGGTDYKVGAGGSLSVVE